ncbi:MAG: hypothetical protein J7L54_07245 [Elusimicrobia bacterium]|nr:hypothetical protein [Elusimicrobiota bacterium]
MRKFIFLIFFAGFVSAEDNTAILDRLTNNSASTATSQGILKGLLDNKSDEEFQMIKKSSEIPPAVVEPPKKEEKKPVLPAPSVKKEGPIKKIIREEVKEKSSVSVKPRFIGRLPAEYNPAENIKGSVWRFSEKPENIAGVNFSFATSGDITGEVDIRAITNEEAQLDKYYTKWYYWTLSLNRAQIKIPFSFGAILAYHNEKIIDLEKPIVNFTPLDLVTAPRVDAWEEKFNPYENDLFYKIKRVPLGIGTQGVVAEFGNFAKIFFADDNTTDEISSLEVDPATGRVILDANSNKILDINEQDQIHHNFFGSRFKYAGKSFEVALTATLADVFRWENASLLDPWDANNTKTNDELLADAGISTDTVVAERFAGNLTASADFKIRLKKNFSVRGEISANRISQKYVSKPVATKIDALLYETKSISVEIPFNNGEKTGFASAVELLWSGRFLSLKAGYQNRTGSYDFDIKENPHSQNRPDRNMVFYLKFYFHSRGKRLTVKYAGENYSVFADSASVSAEMMRKNSVFAAFFEMDSSPRTTFKLNCQVIRQIDTNKIRSQLYPDFELDSASLSSGSFLAGLGFEYRMSKISSLNLNYWEEYVRHWQNGRNPIRKALIEMRIKL